MQKPKGRPGVLLYWETFDALEKLVDGKAKMMLRAIRQYAQHGESPDFSEDPALEMAWTFMKPRIDADAERYEENSLKRRYAAYCREQRKAGDPPAEYESWLQMVSGDII